MCDDLDRLPPRLKLFLKKEAKIDQCPLGTDLESFDSCDLVEN